MSIASPFHGLSAFPPTPADRDGRVDTEALGRLLERLCDAGVASIGLLGSTGIYAFLTREERRRAVEAAVECVRGRVPLVVGVGALRTDHARSMARDAEAAGADALLLAPVSYTPLTQDEAYEHFLAVTEAAKLPLCIYNNPGTTHFTFSRDLLQRLSDIETIRAVKMPLPADGDFADELAALRETTRLAIGYSGDWGAAEALLSGADAWYSVIGGLLPRVALALTKAAIASEGGEVRRLDGLFEPLWQTFKAFGSLRVVYTLVDLLSLARAELPLPLLPLRPMDRQHVLEAVEPLIALESELKRQSLL
ncbi:dihydrodipicolinate synthase family protein [Rhizobium laguerreae]|uniref:dihydrodipicolinate synthase family protein n=1 Tax=Rhizobium laguerreae TaxID=1076926 RepID=UPI001C91812A|nr:dihydrodipicolinate synthase family protein [Rhizobium laguerreae]MBY3035563.1 dihydrodipicolinate synthase family protein [Rhizobium laguerreae]MBY3157009.1 dihydrodipicolinate synthase family protein [Rhizobium laguerreae]MBY3210444.1 dihydrodipicolinate synthase family protein [Rhizobium laguerreae]